VVFRERSECDIPPINDGDVAQALVRFRRDNRGTRSLSGEMSGRTYRYDADYPCFWVLGEDLPKFRLLVDFEVLEETYIDIEKRREDEFERRILERVRASFAPPSAEAAVLPPIRERSGGRPRVPESENQLLVHLRDHVTKRWSFEAIASQIDTRGATRPAEALRARYFRETRERTSLSEPPLCPYCGNRYDPPPPILSLEA